MLIGLMLITPLKIFYLLWHFGNQMAYYRDIQDMEIFIYGI